MWAIRDVGMPILRQLWTVEIGASISLATAEVPPNASMICEAMFSMRALLRQSQVYRKSKVAIIAFAIFAPIREKEE